MEAGRCQNCLFTVYGGVAFCSPKCANLWAAREMNEIDPEIEGRIRAEKSADAAFERAK